MEASTRFDVEAVGVLLERALYPVREAAGHVKVEERCPACHVPLHRGRERHWHRVHEAGRPGGHVVRPSYRKHRCTAEAPPSLAAGWEPMRPR